MMRTTAVIGARAAPVKTAPIPMTPKTAAAEGWSGTSARPKAAPRAPPMKSEGAKTPPAKPTARVRLVATIFRLMSPTSAPAL